MLTPIIGEPVVGVIGWEVLLRAVVEVDIAGAALVLSSGLAPAGPRPQTNLFGQFAALFGIVRRDHRIIRG